MKEIEKTDAQLISELRHMPEYGTIITDDKLTHPFHRRYHSKPNISQADCENAHLVRFRLGHKDAEIFERQKDGLSSSVILIISGKPWLPMRSHLEAEVMVADYLGDI